MGEAKRKKEQFRKNPRSCVFCGSPNGTTMDHVPPRAIFTRPRPQLITVPACKVCNQGSSQLDEEFKVFLGLRVGGWSPAPAANDFWKNGALPSIRKNQRILREVLGGPKIAMRGVDGIVEEGLAFRWRAASHDGLITKITRGLYWHHYREVLPPDCYLQSYFLRGLDNELRNLAMSLNRRNIGGDDIFVYAYGRAEEAPLHSVWIYQFYKGHWAGAWTAPPNYRDEEEDTAP